MEKRLALVGEMRAKWRAIALSPQPMDGDRVEQAVYRAYDTAGLPLTKNLLFVESPRQGAKMAANLGETLAAEFYDPMLGERRFGIPGVSDDALGIAGLFSDLETMTQHVCLLLQEALGATRRNAWYWRNSRSVVCAGQFDAGRLCYEDYKQATARGCVYPFLGMMAMAEACGWWWPYSDACIVSAKPVRIALDSDSRLHNPYGPAMLYPDGFCVWALHGVLMERGADGEADDSESRPAERAPDRADLERRAASRPDEVLWRGAVSAGERGAHPASGRLRYAVREARSRRRATGDGEGGQLHTKT
jgi:hypothetical protein